ncbi:ATP-binding protein [Thermophilibacter sp.]
MLAEELLDLVRSVRSSRNESQTIEVKAAHDGCPTRLYDSLSSFSNQDEGGIILFGLDERKSFEVVGVYDAQDLQKHVAEQCTQMHPAVRAVFTTALCDGKPVVSAEIPGMDVADRPCYYQGRGRLKGSFVRVGESDEPMTEYEVYSYEAFRRKRQDEVEPVPRATLSTLDAQRLSHYLEREKASRPNLARLDDADILELTSITREGVPTLAGVMLFSLFPQAYFPQLATVATVVPGESVGSVSEDGSRFLDNRRIEGTLSEQLSGALAFVSANMRTATRVDPATAQRDDVPEYPLEAVRELLLNALIHRDYSAHTQGMPIQLTMYANRLCVSSPGGLYGRLRINDLGTVRPDTRNPVIATVMEALGETENRYSGIPTVRRLLAESGMEPPLFESARGEFRATIYSPRARRRRAISLRDGVDLSGRQRAIVLFCAEAPRSRAELAELLGLQAPYVMRRYVKPLVEKGLLRETQPETPQSPYQRYVTAEGVVDA